MREQVEVLEHHADLAAHLVDLLQIVGEFLAVDDDLALLVLLQPVDAADHRRLAGARRTADDDALAAHDLEVDVLQHMEVAVPFVHADDLDGDVGVGDVHLLDIDLDLFGADGVFGDHASIPLAVSIVCVPGVEPAFHVHANSATCRSRTARTRSRQRPSRSWRSAATPRLGSPEMFCRTMPSRSNMPMIAPGWCP